MAATLPIESGDSPSVGMTAMMSTYCVRSIDGLDGRDTIISVQDILI